MKKVFKAIHYINKKMIQINHFHQINLKSHYNLFQEPKKLSLIFILKHIKH